MRSGPQSHPAWADYAHALEHLCGMAPVVREVGEPGDEGRVWTEVAFDGGRWRVEAAMPEAWLSWRAKSVVRVLEAMRQWMEKHQPHGAWPEPVRVTWRLAVRHSQTDLSLSSIASHLGVAAPPLGGLVQKVTGLRFRQWLREERVAAAVRRMAADPEVRIGELATSLSPQSVSQFNRSFLLATGLSPSAFRTMFAKAWTDESKISDLSN